MAELTPMPEGGEWMQRSNEAPQYITHREHIKRLHGDGWRTAADPRIAPGAKAATPPETEAALHAQFAQLQGQVTTLQGQLEAEREGHTRARERAASLQSELDAERTAHVATKEAHAKPAAEATKETHKPAPTTKPAK